MISIVFPGQWQLRLLAQPVNMEAQAVQGSVRVCAIASAEDTKNKVFKALILFTEDNLGKVGSYFLRYLLTMKSQPSSTSTVVVSRQFGGQLLDDKLLNTQTETLAHFGVLTQLVYIFTLEGDT